MQARLKTCPLCGRLVPDDGFPKAVADALFRLRRALDKIEQDGGDVREARARLWELAEVLGFTVVP